MKISSSSQQQVSPLNSSYASKNTKVNVGGSDSVKKNSLLEELMKQKQGLIDSKNTLVDKTLKSGESQSSIKDIFCKPGLLLFPSSK